MWNFVIPAATMWGLGKVFGGGGGDDKPDQNPEDPWTAMLGQSAQQFHAQGRELSDMGAGPLANVVKHFEQLTGNNPSAIMQATQPERARVIDQYDTARKAIATFGPAGGGTVSANAQSQFDQAESLSDITSTARRDAFTGAAAIGTSLTGLGLSAGQLASADLNTVINSVLAREGLNTQERGQNMGLFGDIGETVGTLLGVWLGRDGAAGQGAGA
jgi:hypothetical protein